jgi:hypothetical protein
MTLTKCIRRQELNFTYHANRPHGLSHESSFILQYVSLPGVGFTSRKTRGEKPLGKLEEKPVATYSFITRMCGARGLPLQMLRLYFS